MSVSVRRHAGVALVALATFALLAFAAAATADAKAKKSKRGSSELNVMSFNLRFASDTPPNSWPERRPVMRELLRRERPHLIGTQEGLYELCRRVRYAAEGSALARATGPVGGLSRGGEARAGRHSQSRLSR
jgi:hypothetical protein